MTGDRQLADDLLQETYYRFLRASRDYESDAHRRNSLFHIATNLVRDTRRCPSLMPLPDADRLAATPASGSVADDAARRTDLQRAMLSLKPRERMLLWLAYGQGESHREIAQGARPQDRVDQTAAVSRPAQARETARRASMNASTVSEKQMFSTRLCRGDGRIAPMTICASTATCEVCADVAMVASPSAMTTTRPGARPWRCRTPMSSGSGAGTGTRRRVAGSRPPHRRDAGAWLRVRNGRDLAAHRGGRVLGVDARRSAAKRRGASLISCFRPWRSMP